MFLPLVMAKLAGAGLFVNVFLSGDLAPPRLRGTSSQRKAMRYAQFAAAYFLGWNIVTALCHDMDMAAQGLTFFDYHNYSTPFQLSGSFKSFASSTNATAMAVITRLVRVVMMTMFALCVGSLSKWTKVGSLGFFSKIVRLTWVIVVYNILSMYTQSLYVDFQAFFCPSMLELAIVSARFQSILTLAALIANIFTRLLSIFYRVKWQYCLLIAVHVAVVLDLFDVYSTILYQSNQFTYAKFRDYPANPSKSFSSGSGTPFALLLTPSYAFGRPMLLIEEAIKMLFL